MSLNLEKDKKKSNRGWNYLHFYIVLSVIWSLVVLVNIVKHDKIDRNSTNLRIQKCNKVSENIINCRFLIISKSSKL